MDKVAYLAFYMNLFLNRDVVGKLKMISKCFGVYIVIVLKMHRINFQEYPHHMLLVQKIHTLFC